jgi:predicted porin
VVIFGENQYIRDFRGGFICFIQSIINNKNQLILKYDWYDPNRHVKGKQIGAPNSNLTIADVQYNTFGFGGLHHFTPNLKLLLYYDIVKNESTSIPVASGDISDNVFTVRLQFRF